MDNIYITVNIFNAQECLNVQTRIVFSPEWCVIRRGIVKMEMMKIIVQLEVAHFITAVSVMMCVYMGQRFVMEYVIAQCPMTMKQPAKFKSVLLHASVEDMLFNVKNGT